MEIGRWIKNEGICPPWTVMFCFYLPTAAPVVLLSRWAKYQMVENFRSKSVPKKTHVGIWNKNRFLNVLLVLPEIFDPLGILLPHNSVWIAGVFNKFHENYYSIIRPRRELAHKNVQGCTFLCAFVCRTVHDWRWFNFVFIWISIFSGIRFDRKIKKNMAWKLLYNSVWNSMDPVGFLPEIR